MIFPEAAVEDVATRAVKGEFTPVEAINRLLAGAGLRAVHDERSGSFAVSRATASSPRSGGAPTPLRAENRGSRAGDESASTDTSVSSGQGEGSGRIKILATGAFLSSARVQVEGTVISTLSDFSGGYSLTLPAGRHTVEVSYIGLDTARIPALVAAGDRVVLDVNLRSNVYTLDWQMDDAFGRREDSLSMPAPVSTPGW